MSFHFLGKTILIISPEPWNHISVSKHHYAIELAKRGHLVIFLNPPNVDIGTQLQIKRTQISNLWTIDYSGQFTGLRFLPSFIRRFIDRQFLKNLEKFAQVRFDLVWNFENSRFFDLGFAEGCFKIYHQVDLNQDFHVKEAASSADVCFCTSRLIGNELLKYNRNVFLIHHGSSNSSLTFNYNSFSNNSRTRAIYLGNLEMEYIDVNLFHNLVISNPDIEFVLVGPYKVNGRLHKYLNRFSNVVWVGKISESEIPFYLNSADLFLVIYAEKFHRYQSSPHKFMEYFAAGKIIVSTYTDEYLDKKGLLCMADDNNQFEALFKHVILNLDYFNSMDKIIQRKKFAMDNSYSNQFNKIKAFLSERLNYQF
jgi:hypothetical protein